MEQVIQELTQLLPGKVFSADQPEYQETLNSYFSAQEANIEPACVVRPRETSDVSKIVSTLVEANAKRDTELIKFAVRSGGRTSFAGSANEPNGVTIDLRGLNSIEINDGQSQVTIGTGALWGEVYRTLDAKGFSLPGGRHSQLGVGGLTLGGGLSHFSGHVGLVCDNVLEYETVLASGIAVRATKNDDQYKDLFRALRGASNNFGIVTGFKFQIFRQGQLFGGNLVQGIETKDQQLIAFHDFANSSEYDPSASLIQSYSMGDQGTICVNGMVYTKPESEPAVFKPFLKISPIYYNTLRERSLTDLTIEQDSFSEDGLCQLMIATTYYLSLPLLHQTYNLWHASCDNVKAFSGIRWSLTFHPIHSHVIAKSPFLQEAVPTLSANPQRTIIIAHLTGTWKDSQDTAAIEAEAVRLIHQLEGAVRAEGKQTGYVYLNYAHRGQEVFSDGSAKAEERKRWLQGVSRKYDPEGVFQRLVPGGFKLF